SARRLVAADDGDAGRLDRRSRYPQVLRSRMVIPLLKTQLLELARPQSLEQGYCPRLVREQVEVRGWISGHLDGAVVDPVVDPVRRDSQLTSDLRHRLAAGDVTGVRLTALAEQTATQPKDADGAGQHGRVLGGTIPWLREQGRDRLVTLAQK